MKIIITERQLELINRLISEGDFINQKNVDKILDKMNKGKESLSDEELEVLRNPDKEVGLNDMVRGYLEAALFTEKERLEDEEQSEYGDFDISEYVESISFDNFSTESKEYANWDCDKFLSEFSEDELGEIMEYYDLSELGGDFWYTRNGHGVGFWDRDIPDNIKELLMNVVKGFKETYLEYGDDGELHLMKPSDYPN